MPGSSTVLLPLLTVSADQVHVWHASLDVSQPRLTELERSLAPDELARAARFRYTTDRHRFVACRGILREILSRCISVAPGEIEFEYGLHGKPRLKSNSRTPAPLRFNVSHSHGLGVFAVALDREIGVDVECWQRRFVWEEIADSFFSKEEVRGIRALPEEDRYRAFLASWTCKEAYAKARGDGLSLSRQQLDVAQLPGQKSSRWTLKSFTPLPGFAGALAIEGAGRQLTCGPWQG